MQNINTARLVLRNFKADDGAELFDYLSDPRVNCFLADRVSNIEQAVDKAKTRSLDDATIAVCQKDSGALIGELFLRKEEPDTFSVGWHFNAKVAGKGYAIESAKALLHYLFTKKDARRIYAYVEDDNHRSQQLCEKLNMRKEACFMEFISFTNNADGTPKYENTFQYAILKKEWLQSLNSAP